MLYLENESKDMLDKASRRSDALEKGDLKRLRRPFGMEKKHEEVSDQVFDSALSKGRDMLKDPMKYLEGKKSKDYIKSLKDQTNGVNNWLENPMNSRCFTLQQKDIMKKFREEVHEKFVDYNSSIKTFMNSKNNFEQEFKDAAQKYLDYVHRSVFPNYEFATSEEGQGYFADSAGQHFLRSDKGSTFLVEQGVELVKTDGGVEILKSGAGQDFLRSQRGRDFLYEKGIELARTDGGVEILKSKAGQDFLRSERGSEFLFMKSKELVKTDGGVEILKSEAGQDFLRSERGSMFLKWEAVELVKTDGGVEIFESNVGQDFLKSGDGGILFTLSGVELAKTEGGMRLFESKAGQDFLRSQRGEDLFTLSGVELAKMETGVRLFESNVGQDFLRSAFGEDFLFRNGVELAKMETGMRLLKSEAGQDFLKSEKGEEFLDTHHDVFAKTSMGKEYFATEIGQEHLQHREEGRKWSGKKELHTMYDDAYGEDPSSVQENDYIRVMKNIADMVNGHWYKVPKDSREKTYQALNQALDRAKWLENNEGRLMRDPTDQQPPFVIIDTSHRSEIEDGRYQEADPKAVETYRRDLSTQQKALEGEEGVAAALKRAALDGTVEVFDKRYLKQDTSE